MRAVAIIPARGGSKRLPQKNVRVLGGLPLIAHTCRAARSSGVFADVFVNTDDLEIALAAERAGVTCPRLRPASLATDQTPTRDAVVWLLELLAERGQTYDALAILQPTSPLRSAADIRAALALFEENAPCAVKSVAPVAPAHWLGRVDRGGNLDPLPGDEPLVRLNGAIYVYGVAEYLADASPRKTVAYLMPPERSIDIDTAADFRFAEVLAGQVNAPA